MLTYAELKTISIPPRLYGLSHPEAKANDLDTRPFYEKYIEGIGDDEPNADDEISVPLLCKTLGLTDALCCLSKHHLTLSQSRAFSFFCNYWVTTRPILRYRGQLAYIPPEISISIELLTEYYTGKIDLAEYEHRDWALFTMAEQKMDRALSREHEYLRDAVFWLNLVFFDQTDGLHYLYLGFTQIMKLLQHHSSLRVQFETEATEELIRLTTTTLE